MDDAPIVGPQFHRAHPAWPIEWNGEHEVAIDVRAFRRQRERAVHSHREVRFAELPGVGHFRQRRLIGLSAARFAGCDPVGNRLNLLVRQATFQTPAGGRPPPVAKGHVPTRRDLHDLSRATRSVVVAEQFKRSRFVLVMTGSAVFEQDGRDIAIEGGG
jgi:hypothetical protein